MGSPNEALIREGFRAFSERRFDDALANMHPDVEWHIAFRLPDLPPDRDVMRGHDEVRALWNRFADAWETLRFEPNRILYDDGERAIVRVQIHGVGVGSGVEVDQTTFYALTILDDLLVRIVPHDSTTAAAADLGIDERELAPGDDGA